MRVLFTFAGTSGHAVPLVPVAVAVRNAGHESAFSGHRSGIALAEEHGFTIYSAPPDDAGSPKAITPLRPLDMEHEYRVLRDFYAGAEARRRLEATLALSTEWHPDLIVCDEVDFGSMIAAERLGLPHATVLVNASGSFVRPDVVTGSLDTIRAEHGLSPDPELTMPSAHLVVSPFPPSFRDPASPLPENAISIQPGADDDAHPGHRARSGLPVVYLTLGTVFNAESGDLFERALAGLRALPIEVVATVGRDLDPVQFGAQPEHVRIERFIPQADLLPGCDLVVSHGGSGTIVGALANGLPQVVMPMGADQALNADRCDRLGVGVTLDAVAATQGSIGDAVAHVLASRSHRVAAERIRDEIAALPGPEAVVPLIERSGSWSD